MLYIYTYENVSLCCNIFLYPHIWKNFNLANKNKSECFLTRLTLTLMLTISPNIAKIRQSDSPITANLLLYAAIATRIHHFSVNRMHRTTWDKLYVMFGGSFCWEYLVKYSSGRYKWRYNVVVVTCIIPHRWCCLFGYTAMPTTVNHR